MVSDIRYGFTIFDSFVDVAREKPQAVTLPQELRLPRTVCRSLSVVRQGLDSSEHGQNSLATCVHRHVTAGSENPHKPRGTPQTHTAWLTRL